MAFLDYHRTVVGYHGTSSEIADALVEGTPFRESADVDEWLGTGVYFWTCAEASMVVGEEIQQDQRPSRGRRDDPAGQLLRPAGFQKY